MQLLHLRIEDLATRAPTVWLEQEVAGHLMKFNIKIIQLMHSSFKFVRYAPLMSQLVLMV